MVELVSSKLFSGLTKHEVAAILAGAVRRRYEASEIIIQADIPATHLFVVNAGWADYCIVTESGRRILVRRMVPGDAFGVAAFLSEPTGYLGTATAVRDLEVLAWEQRQVRQLARSYPRLAENALRTALHYIAYYAKRHTDLVSGTAGERLVCALTGIAARTGHLIPRGVEVDIKNEDLASLADVSPFTASRILKRWEHKGTLQKTRGRVRILCPERLIA